MIPLNLHQIWYQGKDNIKEPYLTCYKKSMKIIKNTKWKHFFWNKKKIDKLIKTHYKQYWDLYNYFEPLVQKLDVARYIILYHYGGCYMDMDIEIIKDFSKLLKKNDELLFGERTKISNYITNGILFSNKNNKFWLDYLDKINERKNTCNFSSYLNIHLTTGPIYFSLFIYKYKQNNNCKIRILSNEYFEPRESKHDNKKISKNTYTINHFGNSWFTPTIKFLNKMLYYKFIIFGIIIFIILLLNYRKLGIF